MIRKETLRRRLPDFKEFNYPSDFAPGMSQSLPLLKEWAFFEIVSELSRACNGVLFGRDAFES